MKNIKLNLLDLFNEYSSDNGLDIGVYPMDVLDMFLDGVKAIDIIASVDRDFNVHNDYFTHNGNLWQSLDKWEAENHIINNIDRYFSDWLIENGYIEYEEVDQIEEYDNCNPNLYDLIEDYTHEYDTLNVLINNCNIYHNDGMYYVVQVGAFKF